MIKEFNVVSDIYTIPNEKGKQRLIKKGVITRLLINTHDIRFVEEVFDNKGKLLPGVCDINIGDNSRRLQHSFDEIKQLVIPHKATTGYK